MTTCGMSWRGATPGYPRPIIAASVGNFSRDGVSQAVGLYRGGMAHAYLDVEYDVTGVAASWTPSSHAAEQGISTTS
jgi:hypothetical protein